MSSTKSVFTTENEDNFEYFQDQFSNNFIELYSEIKEKIDKNALDLLNQETCSHFMDFVEFIFKSVHFEKPNNEETLDEEIIDLGI